MKRLKDELLQRLHDGTQIVISQNPSNSRSTPAKIESPDADLEAVKELLVRQAQALIKVYHGIQAGTLEPCAAALKLPSKRIEDASSIAMSKFYCYRYDRVPDGWRHLYTDTAVLKVFLNLLKCHAEDITGESYVLDQVTEILDRALITTGGQSACLGETWIGDTLDLLGSLLEEEASNKRQKLSSESSSADFSRDQPYGSPDMNPERECPRYQGWTLDQFESYMNETGAPNPIVFSDLIGDWPALTDSPWKNIDYLLKQTLGGRRLVPVEVGRSYVDEGWGQELIPFKSFLDKYVLGYGDSRIGYMAQHNLFRQIPPLRNDIQIPDFCWADVPKHPTDPSQDHAPLDVPQLNAWFGPARTITPLHTDGYHNLLCQVVGTKYVRLYPPSATPAMRPRDVEDGVNMSNTSAVDIGVVEGWDELDASTDEEILNEIRKELVRVEYRECILKPGDTLLIPMGWWHYVRSLSVSFSVSFWWN